MESEVSAGRAEVEVEQEDLPLWRKKRPRLKTKQAGQEETAS